MFRHIKNALDEEDIEGLLALDCPRDEYDGEASLIEDGIAKASNFGERPLAVDQIAAIVEEVWNLNFGPFGDEEVEKRRPAFESVAKKLLKQQ